MNEQDALQHVHNMQAPWFNYEAIKFFEKYLKPDFSVFEYGSGASTPWLADRVKFVASVEDNPTWASVVSTLIKDKLNTILYYIPMGNPAWLAYSMAINNYPIGTFDVIIIDSTYVSEHPESRAMCTALAIKYIKRPGLIVLDNSDTSPVARSLLIASGARSHFIYGEGYLGSWETGFFFYD